MPGNADEGEHKGTTLTKAAGSAWLTHANGLHARPAIKLTKLAKRFTASVRIGVNENGPWTDVKSIAKVMAMKTPSQVTLFFEADGRDAQAAVRALTALIDTDFAAGDDDDEAVARQPG